MRILVCDPCGKEFTTYQAKTKSCSRRCTVLRYERENPERKMLNHARYRAKKKGVPFNIDLSDINIPSHCPILGTEMFITQNGKSGMHPNSPSLNRKVPELGYVKGNIEVISNRANHLLSNATIDELERVLRHAYCIRS